MFTSIYNIASCVIIWNVLREFRNEFETTHQLNSTPKLNTPKNNIKKLNNKKTQNLSMFFFISYANIRKSSSCLQNAVRTKKNSNHSIV